MSIDEDTREALEPDFREAYVIARHGLEMIAAHESEPQSQRDALDALSALDRIVD